MRGKETARVLLEKLVAHQLEKVGDQVPDHDDFFGYVLFLVLVLS